ncbi:SDR family oxidoreductase [Piscirickettsia litoralis]|uniref:3-oxoacyl-ACP reductase n=1 Tax=Piscirickettsia litoralis TaxID=1891921 RepID=A0ABX3A111_9GAMM|nr:SDR family NAD(P)-dependent oxidoreductase [Piscirickettsia litoralis]ODN42551.1 3-oxoacyl-ACP reductase [Piscirickettsia litoralis]
MANRLKNKVVILTGASRGIGKGIAKVFADEGATLYLVARHQEALLQCAKELAGHPMTYPCDISNEEEVKALINHVVEQEGKIDVLCHNAGVYPDVLIEKMTVQDWDHVHHVNLRGTFLITKECLKHMKAAGYGKVVITSSITGVRVGNPGLAHYSSTKAGINGFVKTAAIEYAQYGITINTVEPGNILTEGLEELGTDYIKAQERTIPTGKLGTPEDIGYASLYFACDESSYVTGQSIVVDGGQILPEALLD